MVAWFTIKSKDQIRSTLADIRERFGSLRGLLPIGGNDPVKLGGNYRVFIFRKGQNTIKIEGPKEVIYDFQVYFNRIMEGSEPEPRN